MGLEMPFGDGLNDAIWKIDRNLSGMGLKMPSGMSIRKVPMLWTISELGVGISDRLTFVSGSVHKLFSKVEKSLNKR